MIRDDPWLEGGFFLGTDNPAQARYFPRVCLSINRLEGRVKPIYPKDWILDSGAFSKVTRDGGYKAPTLHYSKQIKKMSAYGNLLAAVSQDYMCEGFVLKITGLTVKEHQRLTIERYKSLISQGPYKTHLMPVLQGYAPEEYAQHLRAYGNLLKERMWVGVGSVCKRNANPDSVVDVLNAIRELRPDLRLHGFGLKTTALENREVLRQLYSCDSMAWCVKAWREGRNNHCISEADRFRRKIEAIVERGRSVVHNNFPKGGRDGS